MSAASSGSEGFERARALLLRHLDDENRPLEFELLGRRWSLVEGVFSPTYTPVTKLFTSWLPYPDGGSFLEIGSGAGVTAVHAALAGCRRVLATDISEAAVENIRQNIERHRVADRVDVRLGDLFDAVNLGECFDLIYWNSNFAEPPDGYSLETSLHHAFFDPHYATHRRFLRDAQRHLAFGGRLLLGFSSIGNWSKLLEACSEARLAPSVVRSESRQLEIDIEFQLVELSPLEGDDRTPMSKECI